MLDVLTVAALAFVGVRLFGGTRLLVRRDVREHIVGIVRGMRWRHFVLCWPILFLVLLSALYLMQIPGLAWGWWSAIGGVGSPVVGITSRSNGSSLQWLVPAVFAAMLLPALPLFAEAEEQRFRHGAENWSLRRRAGRGLQFGLVHCVIGIPIGVGLALSIGGWYFTWSYLRGFHRGDDRQEAGVAESTRAHLAYNMTVLAIIGLAFLVGA